MNKTVLVAALLISVISAASADVCRLTYAGYHSGKQFDGPTSCANGNTDGILVNGPLTTTSTIFSGAVRVSGPLVAKGGTFQSVHVQGPLIGDKTYLKGGATVNGPVKLNGSKVGAALIINGPLIAIKTWLKDVIVSSNIVTITDSSANNITIKDHDDGASNAPVVFIQGKSTVSGDITFVGRAGRVHLDQTAVIKGKVVNGKEIKA